MKRSEQLIAWICASGFLLLPPYELARTFFGIALLAVAVLPAAGMALLLTLFGRRMAPLMRFLPVAAGYAALALLNDGLAQSGTLWSSAALVLAPLAVAATVMPLIYYFLYRFECRFHRFLSTGKQTRKAVRS